ncbi:MAG: PKD domain-containing protein [Siphonobacter aquaeclarae]|nr:PKD domain-containing protein [Siphonobacter aquaeclarae]
MKHLLPPKLSASFLYLSLLFLLSDCRKDLPKREFPKCETAISSVSHQATQLSVEFTVSSANNATFDKIEWDFGDGKKDSGPSLKVTHKYEAKGIYTVKLLLTDKCGNVTPKEYELTVSDAVIPTLEACSADPSYTSVTFKFKLANDGKAPITSWTVYYSETNPEPGPDTQDPHGEPQSSEKMPVTGETRSLVLGNLKEATKYYYRVYVTNSAGSQKCGESFTTFTDALVETVDASDIKNTTAKLGAVLKKLAIPNVTELGVYISTNQEPNASNNERGISTTTIPGQGVVWSQVANFQNGVQYFYRAYARYNGKEVLGDKKSFVAVDLGALEPNLVAYFNFDNNNVVDLTGNHNATLPNSASYGSGPNARFGRALTLNGSNQYLEIPDKSSLRGRRLSISFWIKTDGIVDRWMQLYSKSVFADGSYEQLSANIKPVEAGQSGNVIINADYKQFSNCENSIGWRNVGNSYPHNPTKWYHIVTVFEGNRGYLYRDGVLVDDEPFPGIELDNCNQGPLRFGAENMRKPADTRFFKGSMDDIRIYDIALQPAQVKGLYYQFQ